MNEGCGCEQRLLEPPLAKQGISAPTERRLKAHAYQARRLAAVFANDVVCRDIRPAHFEPLNEALVFPCNRARLWGRNARRADPRIWGLFPDYDGKTVSHRQTSSAPCSGVSGKNASFGRADPLMQVEAVISRIA